MERCITSPHRFIHSGLRPRLVLRTNRLDPERRLPMRDQRHNFRTDVTHWHIPIVSISRRLIAEDLSTGARGAARHEASLVDGSLGRLGCLDTNWNFAYHLATGGRTGSGTAARKQLSIIIEPILKFLSRNRQRDKVALLCHFDRMLMFGVEMKLYRGRNVQFARKREY